MRVVCWFSCGAASACATYLALKKYPSAEIVRINTYSEHTDNERFTADCERWFGREILIIGSSKYKSVDEVIDSKTFIRGPHGAECTVALKKKVRYAYQQPEDLHVFGFHVGEEERAARIRQSEMIDVWTPLIDAGLTKEDCHGMLWAVGIKTPVMYELGFKHNNCLGCVKASSAGYWNLTRKHFPDVFARRAVQERRVNYAMTKLHSQPIFLDELPPDAGEYQKEDDYGCGILCQIALNS